MSQASVNIVQHTVGELQVRLAIGCVDYHTLQALLQYRVWQETGAGDGASGRRIYP